MRTRMRSARMSAVHVHHETDRGSLSRSIRDAEITEILDMFEPQHRASPNLDVSSTERKSKRSAVQLLVAVDSHFILLAVLSHTVYVPNISDMIDPFLISQSSPTLVSLPFMIHMRAGSGSMERVARKDYIITSFDSILPFHFGSVASQTKLVISYSFLRSCI